MGYSTCDKHGNRIHVDDDGGIDITPKGKSTMMYSLKDIIDAIEKKIEKENADGCKDYWRAKENENAE